MQSAALKLVHALLVEARAYKALHVRLRSADQYLTIRDHLSNGHFDRLYEIGHGLHRITAFTGCAASDTCGQRMLHVHHEDLQVGIAHVPTEVLEGLDILAGRACEVAAMLVRSHLHVEEHLVGHVCGALG